ncbi:hypothetical protein ABZ078_44280 [Streptomyces sp. NPDC006385]|uniref:hypothetical protein n=1 Tax=Streptomyces sp. NPDC006385 TaxID=3156761 RepID=UPI0033A110CB
MDTPAQAVVEVLPPGPGHRVAISAGVAGHALGLRESAAALTQKWREAGGEDLAAVAAGCRRRAVS